MNTAEDLAEITRSWPIDEGVTWTTLHHKGTVWRVTTAADGEFILKKITIAGPGGTQAQLYSALRNGPRREANGRRKRPH